MAILDPGHHRRHLSTSPPHRRSTSSARSVSRPYGPRWVASPALKLALFNASAIRHRHWQDYSPHQPKDSDRRHCEGQSWSTHPPNPSSFVPGDESDTTANTNVASSSSCDPIFGPTDSGPFKVTTTHATRTSIVPDTTTARISSPASGCIQIRSQDQRIVGSGMLSLSTTPPGIHSVFSNFPASKALPLPGTQPTNMDESYGLTQGGNFTAGEHVCVRKFDLKTRNWGPSQAGVVVQFSVLRGFLGIHARSYIVDVRSPSGDTKRNSYAPFLAEITRQDENFDSLTRNECWERRKRFDWIYALIPVDPLPLPKQAARREKTFNLTKNAVWQPVSVISIQPATPSMDQAPTFDVVILFGGMAGQVYSDISIVHPYNEGTQKVLRRHGQSVMSETGLVLPPTHFPSGR